MAGSGDGSSIERVIAWLRGHIADGDLKPGDPLPREIDIAAAVGVARSSVREALTGLRALGLIDSRRRGGMRLLREPVLLDLREWFAPSYDSKPRHEEALEFRAVVEQGLIELVFARITDAEIAQLRKLFDSLAEDSPDAAVIEVEKRFHRLLMKASRNKLAILLSALITPVFDTVTSSYSVEQFRRDHLALVVSLERRDREAFTRAMRAHTSPYLRLQSTKRSPAK
jgi:DNA-binding FadR family transcriptional regulator